MYHPDGSIQANVCQVIDRMQIEVFCDWYIRSEEHTSELQSQSNLVCRLLLEKENMIYLFNIIYYDSSFNYFIVFFIKFYDDHRDLHSFPTRRSSDLCW